MAEKNSYDFQLLYYYINFFRSLNSFCIDLRTDTVLSAFGC